MITLQTIFIFTVICSAYCEEALRKGDWFVQRTNFSDQFDCYRLDLNDANFQDFELAFAETFFNKGLRVLNRGYLDRVGNSSSYERFDRNGNSTAAVITVFYSDRRVQVIEVANSRLGTRRVLCLTDSRIPTWQQQRTLNRECNPSDYFSQSQDGCCG